MAIFDSVIKRIFGHHGRSQYKQVWNDLSTTEKRAMKAVAGIEDEAEFAASAPFTLQTLMRCVGIRQDDTVLEIGAGIGRTGAILAPLCRKWIGTDVSDNMVHHIRRRLSRYPNVRAIATNGYDLSPVESASINVVYCTVVFMHLSQWERYGYVKEAFRVLKPGGRLFVDSVNMLSDAGWKMFEEVCATPPEKRPPNINELSTPQVTGAKGRAI